jgi:hypothetical protein
MAAKDLGLPQGSVEPLEPAQSSKNMNVPKIKEYRQSCRLEGPAQSDFDTSQSTLKLIVLPILALAAFGEEMIALRPRWLASRKIGLCGR